MRKGSEEASKAKLSTKSRSYELVLDLDAAGNKAMSTAVEKILAERAAVAEAAGVDTNLADSSTELRQITSPKNDDYVFNKHKLPM